MRESEISTTTIGKGAQGTRETLRIMAGMVRHAVSMEPFREFALFFPNAQSVEVIRKYFRYTPEDVETLYSPEYQLYSLIHTGQFTGDCDDIAMMYAAIFHVLGLSTRFVAMKTKRNDPEFLHVVVETFENNRWKRFDPTVKPGMIQIDFGQMVEYI